MFKWFVEKGLRQGIFWSIMIYLQCSVQDVLIKFLGQRLHHVEIVFFRFLFSMLVVLLPILVSRKNLLKTSQHKMHVIRGVLGALALALCAFAVIKMPLAENTTIMFSQALFTVLLSIIFLKEKITMNACFATVIGFLGVLVMFRPSAEKINMLAVIPITAAVLFSVSNIIIKKMLDKQENSLTMLFYFGLYTTIISGIFVPFFWITPRLSEMLLLFCLGVGANLMQLFIFLAFRATTVSSIGHVQYIELLFSTLFGFYFFNEIPENAVYIGAALIILGVFISSISKNSHDSHCH